MENEIKESVLARNIAASVLCLKTGEFQLMNILGNRIMSDCLLSDYPDEILLGFFVKQVAITCLSSKSRLDDAEFSKVKIICERYLDTLQDSSKKPIALEAWLLYHTFNIDVAKITNSDVDKQIKAIYQDEPSITREMCRKLIHFVSTNRDILEDPNNKMFEAIISDLQRLGLSYGYEVIDTIIYSLMLSLQRFWEYFKIQCMLQDKSLDSKLISKVIYPYIDGILNISNSQEVNFKYVANLFFDLFARSRELFFMYGELSGKPMERPIELNQETKRKLSEVVSKALQKEVNP